MGKTFRKVKILHGMDKAFKRMFCLCFVASLLIFCCFLSFFSFGTAKANSFLPSELGMDGQLENAPKNSYTLPIIMYHSTFHKRAGQFNVPPVQLEKDFIYLKENGYQTVTVSDLLLFQESGVSLPEKPIMLSFDDGYTNNYLYMFPLLKKYSFKCVLSVVGFLTDCNYSKDGECCNPTNAHMDYSQIKELHDSGLVEIQNHSYNMHRSGGARHGLSKRKDESAAAYQEKLTKDLKMLDDKLYEHCGIKTTAVVYPFGAYSKETVPILKQMGYKSSLTCRAGLNEITRTSSLFNLRRNNRPYGKSSSQYFEGILK